MGEANRVEAAILDVVYGEGGGRLARGVIAEHGFGLLPLLATYLSRDLPIEILERFEAVLKSVLRTSLKGTISGRDAREVVLFQKNIGFLLKYKPYAIKCSSPLGYSLFIQSKGEGFSFQRHLAHKIELFHILEVQQGGYVFICDFADWTKFYRRDSFGAWLSGNCDERFNRYRFDPEPGDVFMIDRLGLVHSVIGCTLEEFATVSTDMVDRLHDQNAGRSVAPNFNRSYAQERLQAISMPRSSRRIETCSQRKRGVEIPSVEIPGGQMFRLGSDKIIAYRYVIEPSKMTEIQKDDACAASVYITQGRGCIIIGEREEVWRLSPPSIQVSAGDLLMIPAGVWYGFVSEGPDSLVFSEHRIPFDVAFV